MEAVFLFQSPSLRGSGRFDERTLVNALRKALFQSPSLRGSGRFTPPAAWRRGKERKFQSPSLRGSGRFALAVWRAWQAEKCFNPLHCGAVVASSSR